MLFGGHFNRLPFNRQLSTFVFGRVVMNGEGALTAVASLEMSGSVKLEGEGSMKASYVREISFAAHMMHGEGSMTASFVRERLQRAVMNGVGTLKAKGSRYHVDYIEFIDAFNPGDRIVIDSGKFKITRNGINVSHLYEGDFFNLNLGTNNLTWTDPETNRTILFRITHKDKYLY